MASLYPTLGVHLYPLARHQPGPTQPSSALTRCRTHRHCLQHTEPVLRARQQDESADTPPQGPRQHPRPPPSPWHWRECGCPLPASAGPVENKICE